MTYYSKDKKFRLCSFHTEFNDGWILEKKNPKEGFFRKEYLHISYLTNDEKLEAIFDLKLIPEWQLIK